MGNAQAVTWPVTVRDQDPPLISVPADVRVDAQGVRTIVELGTVTVSDNVSVSLTVTNDAPDNGFVVGDTDVLWRVVTAPAWRAKQCNA